MYIVNLQLIKEASFAETAPEAVDDLIPDTDICFNDVEDETKVSFSSEEEARQVYQSLRANLAK